MQHLLGEIIGTVLQAKVHEDIVIEKYMIDKQDISQYRSLFADNDGQKSDYRIPLEDGRGIHIKEYDTNYKIHWDHHDLKSDPIGHLLDDCPHHKPKVAAGIGIGIALAVGVAVAHSRK